MMPIDYKKYPDNWKQIRSDILARANNKCEQCNVPNHKIILRGTYNERDVYQCPDYGQIYCANTSEYLGSDYFGEVDLPGKNKLIKVVLTISHTDHNIENNDYTNLKALCQRCHLRHDKDHHAASRRNNRIKTQPELPLTND